MTLGGRKIPFDPASLKVLEDLSEATWLIFESRHPFRDVASDDRLREVLRLKLFIRAENHGLANWMRSSEKYWKPCHANPVRERLRHAIQGDAD